MTRIDRHVSARALEKRAANAKDRWRQPNQQRLSLMQFIVEHRSLKPGQVPARETEG
jgi:hypothetical protein